MFLGHVRDYLGHRQNDIDLINSNFMHAYKESLWISGPIWLLGGGLC